MDKVLYNKFDKNDIKGLPQALFNGRIIVVLNDQEARKAVDFLLSQDILGVDTETRPAFKKGQHHKVSLLQVASEDTCFLFRLNLIGLTDNVKRLLSNVKVPMIGLSWHDDLCMLHSRGEFVPGYFIDIQDMIEQIGIEDKSLQKIYANIFHQKISKRQRLTNWDADILTDKQKLYAATDAWACIKLYKEIIRLKKTGAYSLITKPEV